MCVQRMMRELQKLSRKKLVNNALNECQDIFTAAAVDDDDEGHDIAIIRNEYPMGLQHVKQKEEEENFDTNDQNAPKSVTAAAASDADVDEKKNIL